MTVMDRLQARLDELNMNHFFLETRKELGEYGIIILAPHKEKDSTFTSVVGILGDDSFSDDYTIDVLKSEAFIMIGLSEITIHSGRGVSMTFFTNPSALFSYITYPLLRSTAVAFSDGEIRCDLDLFTDLIRDMKEIRGAIDRSLRIRLKIYKKTYISKCKSLANIPDAEIKEIVNNTTSETNSKSAAWRSALYTAINFMEGLE